MQLTKSSSLFGFSLTFTMVLVSISAMAQESSGFPNEENRNPYELNQTLDSHSNSPREAITQRDSLSVKPVITIKPKANEAANKPKTQEEPLSFNFLYYIIQKFKSSDAVVD